MKTPKLTKSMSLPVLSGKTLTLKAPYPKSMFVHVRLSAALHGKFDKECAARGLTRSEVLRALAKAFVDSGGRVVPLNFGAGDEKR